MPYDDLGIGAQTPQPPQPPIGEPPMGEPQPQPSPQNANMGQVPPPPQPGQVPPQPQYPPQQPYGGYNPYAQYNIPRAHGIIWVKMLKVLVWILFAAICLVGFVAAAQLFDYGQTTQGLVTLLLSVVTGFLSVAGVMVYLNMAENVSKIRQALEQMNNKMK